MSESLQDKELHFQREYNNILYYFSCDACPRNVLLFVIYTIVGVDKPQSRLDLVLETAKSQVLKANIVETPGARTVVS